MNRTHEDVDLSLPAADDVLANVTTVSTKFGADYAAQIRLLFHRAPVWISLNLIAAVVFAGSFWSQIPEYLLAPWLIFITATSALHVLLVNYFTRAGSTDEQLPAWSKISLLMIASNGLAWGVGCWLMLPALSEPQRIVASAMVVGVTLVSIPSLAIILRMHSTFSIVALMPLLAWHLSESNWDASLLLLLVAATATVFALARNYSLLAKNAVAGEFRELLRAFAGRYAEQGNSLRQLHKNLAQAKISADSARDDRDRARASLGAIGEAVITATRDGNIDFINPVAEVLTGWTAADVVRRPLTHVFTTINSATPEKPENPIEKCMRTQRIVVGDEHTALIRKDGLQYAVEHVCTPIRDQRGNFCGVVLVFRDVTERRRSASKMAWRATHDPLTGLINRSEFETRLGKLLKQPRQSERKHALCYLDLDRFKLINDNHGHNVGDAFLKGLAERLGVRVRGADTLARLGGDEFAILLYSCPIEKAAWIARDLCKRVEEFEHPHKGEKLTAGASVGVVEIDDSLATLTDVLGAADTACYAAKNRGGNNVQVYSANAVQNHVPGKQLSLLHRVQHALAGDDFSLYVQTIHPLDGSNKRCCELSLRLKNQDGDLISTNDYRQAAERYHLLPKLDGWLVKAAVDALRLKHPALAKMDIVNISISEQSLNDDRFLEFLLSSIQEPQVASERICFEIAETGLIKNLARARYFIAALRDTGCRFSLQDHGNSLSSFANMKSANVDFIKISQELVGNIEYSSVDFEIDLSLVRVARTMNIRTIANGVASKAMCTTLRRLGVDFVQGQGLTPPRPMQIVR